MTTTTNINRRLQSFPPGLTVFIALSLFTYAGYSLGTAYISPISAAAPSPGSPEDELALTQIQNLYEQLEIVRTLREKGWKEHDAYAGMPEERKWSGLQGSLRGAGRVGLQKVFWNERDKKAVSVVWLGRSVCGWPSIVHGGMLATLLDESLGRVAIRCFPAGTGVTASLTLHYRKPTMANQFVCVFAELDEPKGGLVQDSKANVKGWVETTDHSVTCEAEGLFVVPKKLRLRRVGEF